MVIATEHFVQLPNLFQYCHTMCEKPLLYHRHEACHLQAEIVETTFVRSRFSVISPFQWSQHRKQFQRSGIKKITPICYELLIMTSHYIRMTGSGVIYFVKRLNWLVTPIFTWWAWVVKNITSSKLPMVVHAKNKLGLKKLATKNE